MYCFDNNGNGGDTVRTVIRYREHELDLTNELNLTNESTPTVVRLNGHCAFSKVAPRGGLDISKLFEPTALTHKRCTNTGFSNTSVVTYMWAIRLQKLAGISNNIAKVLLGMHYSTLLTHNVIRDHFDTKYYSGMSYLNPRLTMRTRCTPSTNTASLS